MSRTATSSPRETGRIGGNRPAPLPADELDRVSAGTLKLGTSSNTFFTILR